jgi:hypothetical protein
LIKLTLLLCILMQVVYGATYRTGLMLCVPLPLICDHCHEDGAADDHERVCHHHHPVNDRTPHPGRGVDCPNCVDMQMPDSTMPPARLALAIDGGASIAAIADLPSAILPGPEFGVAAAFERALAHPPDRAASRVASGLTTTRLRI